MNKLTTNKWQICAKSGMTHHIVRFVRELFIVRFVRELYWGSTHSGSSMISFIVRFMKELYFSSTHKKSGKSKFSNSQIRHVFRFSISHIPPPTTLPPTTLLTATPPTPGSAHPTRPVSRHTSTHSTPDRSSTHIWFRIPTHSSTHTAINHGFHSRIGTPVFKKNGWVSPLGRLRHSALVLYANPAYK